MSGYFPAPPVPPRPQGGVFAYIHDHEWVECGAQVNPNGTWSALFSCARCPDIAIGGKAGPIPDGYCPCGWVQKKPGRKKCEECKRPMERTPA